MCWSTTTTEAASELRARNISLTWVKVCSNDQQLLFCPTAVHVSKHAGSYLATWVPIITSPSFKRNLLKGLRRGNKALMFKACRTNLFFKTLKCFSLMLMFTNLMYGSTLRNTASNISSEEGRWQWAIYCTDITEVNDKTVLHLHPSITE